MSQTLSAIEKALPEIGESLRRARAERNISIEQAAEQTRISASFLRALETESFDQLPAPVYVRGFLRSYATYLGLDYEPLMEELSRQREGRVAGPDAFVPGPSGPAQRQNRDPFRREPERPAGVVPFRREDEPSGVQEEGPDGVDEDAPAEDGWEWEEEAEPTYRARYTPGVLTERGYRYDEGTPLRGIALVAIGVIAVAFVAFVAYILATGDGDDEIPFDNPTSEPTDAGGGQTVIAVGSPTATPDPAGTATPGGDESPTPDNGETPTPGEGTPTAAATPTEATTPGQPTATPTATETPTPTPTPSPTPVPATPTATAVPTPAPPGSVSECTALGAGSYDCGEPPYRIICVPSTPATWFFDIQRRFDPLPVGWVEVGYFDRQGTALSAGQAWAANGCSPP